ncbi:hypothetical protein DFH28DRAFT_975661 [Melampsora americana]|nr:hypothetical protein DFH28DRAFT_975661 [Melampsora americana]
MIIVTTVEFKIYQSVSNFIISHSAPYPSQVWMLPDLFCCLPPIRTILIQEKIETLHAHQAMSSLGLKCWNTLFDTMLPS